MSEIQHFHNFIFKDHQIFKTFGSFEHSLPRRVAHLTSSYIKSSDIQSRNLHLEKCHLWFDVLNYPQDIAIIIHYWHNKLQLKNLEVTESQQGSKSGDHFQDYLGATAGKVKTCYHLLLLQNIAVMCILLFNRCTLKFYQ